MKNIPLSGFLFFFWGGGRGSRPCVISPILKLFLLTDILFKRNPEFTLYM